MDNSILNDVKAVTSVGIDYTPFDQEQILFINSLLASLFHMSPAIAPVTITGEDGTWDLIFKEDVDDEVKVCLPLIKEYVALKTRLMFDPPASSTIVEVYKDRCTELEWRINSITDWEQISVDEKETDEDD